MNEMYKQGWGMKAQRGEEQTKFVMNKRRDTQTEKLRLRPGETPFNSSDVLLDSHSRGLTSLTFRPDWHDYYDY